MVLRAVLIFLAMFMAGCSGKDIFSGNQQQTFLIIQDSTRAVDVSWSPNGSKVAYSTGREIRFLTLPSKQGKILAETEVGILTAPSWSPTDPSRIAYVKTDPSGTTATIIESDTLGQDADTVFDYTSGQLGVGFVYPESLCLDLLRPQYGTRIYIAAVGNKPGVWTIDTTLNAISFLLEGRWPDVDPSETYLAYAAKHGGIMIRNLDSLTTDTVSTTGLYPSWSPDAEQIAYSVGDTVCVWSRTTGQLKSLPMSESITNLSWRRPPNVYHIALRIPSDGTVWLLNTFLPTYSSTLHPQTPLQTGDGATLGRTHDN
jgi:hypothetical protein